MMHVNTVATRRTMNRGFAESLFFREGHDKMSGTELIEIDHGYDTDMGIEGSELEVLTPQGVATGELQSPILCHEKGLWHRAVSILLFTEWGEVVLEKRTGAQVLEPNRFAIPEEHVPAMIAANLCVLNGVVGHYGFRPDAANVQMLTAGDTVLEESQFPAVGLCNRERKTLYAYTLSWSEYQAIQERPDAVGMAGRRARVGRVIADRSRHRPPDRGPGASSPRSRPGRPNTPAARSRSSGITAGEVVLQFWRDLVKRRRATVLDAISRASTTRRSCP